MGYLSEYSFRQKNPFLVTAP